MALRNWLRSRSANAPHHPAPRPRLGVQQLEAREVPAALVSALGIGSSTDDVHTAARDVAADSAGNSYMTGRFSGTIDFDPGRTHPNDADMLTARGFHDIFVSKHAPDGSLVWATRMGGQLPDPLSVDVEEGKSISVKNGVVAVTGYMRGTGDFGPYTLVSAGGNDGFVAKLDAATGAVGWAARWGTAGSDVGTGVDTDGAGNVYVLTERPNHTLLKFSPSGSLVWSKFVCNPASTSGGGTEGDLAVDAAGNVYATGAFEGSADLNPGTRWKDVFSVYSRWSAGFALKLNANGTFVWASPFVSQSVNGVVGFSNATSIALDGSGNVFVGGNYGGPVDFNPGTGTASLPTAGGAFVTKLDSVGRLVWAQGLVKDVSAGGSAQVYGLATDAFGNVYATGYYYGTVDFDPGAGTDIRQSFQRDDGTRTNTDIFVVKLTGTGRLGWAETFGGRGYEYGHGVAVDPSGVVHLAGLYWSLSIDFDPDPLAIPALTKTGNNQWLFLVKLR